MPGRAPEPTAVFVNAEVLTMDERRPVAQAVAVRGGRILAVGDLDPVLAAAGRAAQVVDLGGNTLMPGFFDGHGHFTQVANELDWVDLSPPPAGTISSIEDIISALRARLGQLATEHKYILGAGYDESILEERRHPTKEDLDRVCTDLPIWVVHASRRMAVGNSMALDQAGIAAATPDPVGGTIVRRPGSREPTGLLQEAAWAHVRLTFLPPVAEHHHTDLMRRTGQYYARLGITTAQDGATDVGGMKMLRGAAQAAAAGIAGSIPIDVICYPLYQLADRLRPDADPFRGGYTNHVRVGGLEIVLDAIPPFADDDVYRMVADCFARSIQVLARANGDAASEQMIEAVARAERRHGRDAGARRPVMVQPQTVSDEQLDRMLALGIVPSFFGTHCFYLGDRAVTSALGRERAYRISPARSAARRGLRFSLHNDSPAVPPNSLFLVWNAVTRLSRGGEVIGPDQRLTPAEALRAVTLDAAYQCFEDGAKGSIEVGKLADMVVLSDNPLRVAPEAIREIAVLATLKEGVPIHILERARLPEALAAAQIG